MGQTYGIVDEQLNLLLLGRAERLGDEADQVLSGPPEQVEIFGQQFAHGQRLCDLQRRQTCKFNPP
jgi:hypothetical protein